MAKACSTTPRTIRQIIRAAAANAVMIVAITGWVDCAERDLYAGLGYLRKGAQSQAVEYLTRYRDGSRDPAVRERVSRVLPLLQQPLSEDVREYLALTIEESAGGANRELRTSHARPSYWSRTFPVFP
jgi:hypothetical protein